MNRREVALPFVPVAAFSAAFLLTAASGCGEKPPERAARIRSLETIGGKITRNDAGTVIDIRNAPEFTDAAVDLVLKESDVVDLTMQGVPITDAGLAKLWPLDKLGRLILNDTQVTGDGVRELTEMPLKESLWNIALKNTSFGDGDVTVLKEFPRLTRVDLSGTKVTDAGLDELPDKRFGMINVTGTAVTDAGVEKLAKRFPGTQILR